MADTKKCRLCGKNVRKVGAVSVCATCRSSKDESMIFPFLSTEERMRLMTEVEVEILSEAEEDDDRPVRGKFRPLGGKSDHYIQTHPERAIEPFNGIAVNMGDDDPTIPTGDDDEDEDA